MATKPGRRKAAAKKPVADAAPAAAPKVGRPIIWNQELADQILDRLACGETLTKICKTPDMPDRATVRRWIHRYPEFCTAYSRSRELFADILGEEVLDIADDSTGDVTIDANGKRQIDWESVQRAKLRCDMRRWYAAKICPRLYGEKITQQLTGPADGPIAITRADDLLPKEVAAAVAELLGIAEHEMGLPPGDGKSDRERIEAIKAVNGTLPPALYGAVHQAVRRKPDEPVH